MLRFYLFVFKDCFFRFFVLFFFFLSKHPSFGKTLKHYRSFFISLNKSSFAFNYLLYLEKRYRLFSYKRVGQELFIVVKIIDGIFGKGFFFYAGLDFTLYRLFHFFIIIYYHLRFFFFGTFRVSNFIDFSYII